MPALDLRICAACPVEPIDHQCHIASAPVLLLLEVIELQFGDSISILPFAVDPYRTWIYLSCCVCLALWYVLIINLYHVDTH